MVENFRAGLDPHTELAKMLMTNLGIEYSDPITDVQRQAYGKTPNFAIVYAGGWPTIERQLTKAGIKCDKALALTIFQAIKSTMPEVGLLEKEIHIALDDRGYIKTLWGRELHPDLNKYDRRGAYRKMLNALIQGCAADLFRHAFRSVHYNLEQAGCKAHVVNGVHDEIAIDAPADEVDFLAEYVPQWMDYEVISRVLPVTTSMEVSTQSWADKAPYN
jgi:DNA polymerase I